MKNGMAKLDKSSQPPDIFQKSAPDVCPIDYNELKKQHDGAERSRGFFRAEMVNLFLHADTQITVISGEMDTFFDKNLVEAIKQIIDKTRIGSFNLIGGQYAKKDDDNKIPFVEMIRENQENWEKSGVNTVNVYCNNSEDEKIKKLLKYHCIVVDAGRIIAIEDAHEPNTDVRDKRHLWIENDFQLGYQLLHNIQFAMNRLNRNDFEAFYMQAN